MNYSASFNACWLLVSQKHFHCRHKTACCLTFCSYFRKKQLDLIKYMSSLSNLMNRLTLKKYVEELLQMQRLSSSSKIVFKFINTSATLTADRNIQSIQEQWFFFIIKNISRTSHFLIFSKKSHFLYNNKYFAPALAVRMLPWEQQSNSSSDE